MNSIKLNIGGVRIETYTSTLLQLDYFKAKLERWNNEETELFVDYDYDLFKHLVNKLRDASYEMPNNKNIVNMCNYFGYTIVNECKKNKLCVVKNVVLKQSNSFMEECLLHKMKKGTKIIDLQIIPSYTHSKGCDIYFTDSKNNDIFTIKDNQFFRFFERQTPKLRSGNNNEVLIEGAENSCFLRKNFIEILRKIKGLQINVKNLHSDQLIIYYEEII